MQTQHFFKAKTVQMILLFLLFITGTSMINIDVSPNIPTVDRKTVVIKGGQGSAGVGTIYAIDVLMDDNGCVDPNAPFFINLVNAQGFKLEGLNVSIKTANIVSYTGLIDLLGYQTIEIPITLPGSINNSPIVTFEVIIDQLGTSLSDLSAENICGGGNNGSVSH